MSVLCDAFERARGEGRGTVALLVGDAGIGKSRIADELASYAQRSNAEVLAARCPPGAGAPPLWVWRQLLRECDGAIQRSPSTLASAYTALLQRVDGATSRESATGLADERFQIFDGIALFLKQLAHDRPLVLVLDDLQWAEVSSLQLLEFLAREIAGDGILIVGTCRDGDPPFVDHLARLAQEPIGEKILLRGMTAEDARRFVRSSCDRSFSNPVIDWIHRETEGNPGFIAEYVRDLVSQPRPPESALETMPVPRGIRQNVGQSLTILSPECTDLLRIASVLGRDFAVDLLERVGQESIETILAALDEAQSAGIIEPVDHVRGGYRFSKALARRILSEELATPRRLRLHRCAAQVLRDRYESGRHESDLSDIATHLFHTSPFGDAEDALTWLCRAAEVAYGRGDLIASKKHLERALTAFRFLRHPDDTALSRILIELGRTLLLSGEVRRARPIFAEAAELGRKLGAPETLARAGIGLAEASFEYGRADDGVHQHLVEAANSLGRRERALQAKILSALSAQMDARSSHFFRDALSRESIAVARRLGEPRTLAYALLKRQWISAEGETVADRLAAADEVISLAREAGNRILEAEGRYWRIAALNQMGETTSVDREVEICEEGLGTLLAPRSRSRLLRIRAMRALFDGRFELAERCSSRAQEISPDDATPATEMQIAQLRLLQGRGEEILVDLERRCAHSPLLLSWRALLAYTYAVVGRLESARVEFERILGFELSAVDAMPCGSLTLGILAELAAVLDDREHAEQLYERLLPHAGVNLESGLGIVAIGSAHRPLALLAMVTGQWDRAEMHFERALLANLRMGARPWIAQTQLDFACMLQNRGRAEDRLRATQLRDRCRETAETLGMKELLRRIERLEIPEDDIEATPVAIGEFRLDGDHWTIAYGESQMRLKNQLGLRYLAELLRTPGTEIHSVDLLSVVRGGCAAGSPDEHDRGNIAALREELDEAETFNDLGRVARVQAELDLRLDALAQSIRPGGKRRQSGTAGERARVSVTRTIKAALTKIQSHDPDLGAHLLATVRTGTYACYNPDPRVPVTWEVAEA